MKIRWMFKSIGVLWLLSACVTINVYFPAAAAEEAADKIINEVWGEGEKPGAKPAERKTSSRYDRSGFDPSGGYLLFAANSVLNFLVPAAHAQGANLDISSPAIVQIRSSMTARHAQLEKFYASGAVGLTANGLIEVRDLNAVALPDRTSVRKLVTDENADRANLYREIAVANSHPEWESDIRSTFAQRWIANAKSGWYYQDGGGWKQK